MMELGSITLTIRPKSRVCNRSICWSYGLEETSVPEKTTYRTGNHFPATCGGRNQTQTAELTSEHISAETQKIPQSRSTAFPRHQKKHNTKTYLCNCVPLKPHFYIVKLGFTGVHITFVISAQKQRLWYSLEPPRRCGSNEYQQSMFWAEILWKKYQIFVVVFLCVWKFSFLGGKIFSIFE